MSRKMSSASTSSIKIRYYKPTDGEHVRELFKTSLSVGADSPLHHLFRHELKSSRAFISYMAVFLGIATALAPKARQPIQLLTAAAFVIIGSTSFVSHLLYTYGAFMAFVNGSIGGPDMQDVPRIYGMVESTDPAKSSSLVPYGKNAFWVAEASVIGASGELQTEVVGCVGLDINSSPGDTNSELRRLAVSAECRGQGIARMLLQELVAHARATGVQTVWLRTSSSNVGALAAYRKLGFQVERAYDPFKNLDTHVLTMEVENCTL